MSDYEERKRQRKENNESLKRSAAADEKTARETGRLADAQADTAYANHRLADEAGRANDINEGFLHNDNIKTHNDSVRTHNDTLRTASQLQVDQSEIQVNRAKQKAIKEVGEAEAYKRRQEGDATLATAVGALDDAGVERVDTYKKDEEDRANIQQVCDQLGDSFSTIDEQGQPNSSFNLDPYSAIRPSKDSKIPAPTGTLSARSYANIVAAMTKMRDLRTEIERVRKWDANQSREGTLEKIEDYLERGKAARKSQAEAYFEEREKEHKKWLLINLIAIPVCFYGIMLCYAGLVAFGVLIWMAFQRIAFKPSNQRDLETDAGTLAVTVDDTKALIGQVVLIVAFVGFAASQFMLSDAIDEATKDSLKPQILKNTPLNPKIKGTWKSTNNAEKTLTISPIGMTLNSGESTFDIKMAGINCQGDVCAFNNGINEGLTTEISNPEGKAYVEEDQLTISGSDFRINGVWIRGKAAAAKPKPEPAPAKTAE